MATVSPPPSIHHDVVDEPLLRTIAAEIQAAMPGPIPIDLLVSIADTVALPGQAGRHRPALFWLPAGSLAVLSHQVIQ